jgi:Tol biopolymer transport system component
MSFSPDRSLILDVRGHKSLWIYPVNGQAAHRVFAFSDPDIRIDYPTWSPDGRWVLFDRAAPRGGDLWVLEESE